MFDWLKPKTNFLEVDLHSHLIPNIDDGVKSWKESLEIIHQLSLMGYKKLITTPHIIQNYYPNKPSDIREKVTELNARVLEEGIPLVVEAGAEYFIDEHFANQVETEEELLTFGDGHILVETPFMNKPLFLEDIIFKLQSRGLKPILAHPERYTYLHDNLELLHSLSTLGLFMQVNISSLTGYYSKEAKKFAKRLIETGNVHFLASDIHNHKHLAEVQKAIKSQLFQKCRQLNLHNSSLY
ncbi:Tyrosine-protein phosphatase YwqE [Reichenbachiella faecimaris]|uniref:protein-tyrosine-phosphatase n=1 Tax=Reichenbachiella faecimaris TaxID=692418 RepID=A0A1W2GF47_REIFA|nr:CpsB/CapC family capsule biosynthesis tyrosine phosphatase [Reichenbachiella faecimaris]SMD35275.1 Tyrosine-protein phosphatase YwqE [Reichenbachiella faecimaris]